MKKALADKEDLQANADIDLGAKIRTVRKAKQLTLQQVSDRSGVSIATLSKIENGQAVGSLNTVYKIARGLGILVVDLVAPHEAALTRQGRLAVNKNDSALCHKTDFYDYFIHANSLNSKRMVPLVMHIHTETPPPLEDWSQHAGEEFVYIITGSIAFHCEEYAPVTLEPGESLYFDSAMRHAFVKTSTVDAVILSIATSAP